MDHSNTTNLLRMLIIGANELIKEINNEYTNNIDPDNFHAHEYISDRIDNECVEPIPADDMTSIQYMYSGIVHHFAILTDNIKQEIRESIVDEIKDEIKSELRMELFLEIQEIINKSNIDKPKYATPVTEIKLHPIGIPNNISYTTQLISQLKL